MANSNYGGVIYCDAAGILSKIPVYVVGILQYPAAVEDALDLNFWDENSALGESYITGTVHATNHIDSTGSFTDTTIWADGNVVKLSQYSGTYKTENETYHLIGTRADNTLTAVEASFTADSECKMKLTSYPTRPFFNCLQPKVADSHQSKWHYMGGIYAPNLVCEGITASSYAIIYVR
jgi:hypothetical protein